MNTIERIRPSRATAVSSAGGWDSEVIILDGHDRADLLDRARALSSFLDEHPSVSLPSLALTLARNLGDGKARLSFVASTSEDAQKKLGRAMGRLADPACQQIRDAAGIYFFEQPLYVPGNLALLFPGEGAQYMGMMADLCEPFPEVEETFAICDQIAKDSGRPDQSLRRIIHPAADASEAEKAFAETELRKLGPSILGVLIGDLVLERILRNLRVPASAIAGHSAGELAALVASGAIPEINDFSSRLSMIQDLMQRQEDEATGVDVALVAVGAGGGVVKEIAANVAGGAVIVAMDNCPHQCVAVGPTHLVAAIEEKLRERSLICERLPFNRPYHTPLFEPWMPPFRELFQGIPFVKPPIPVYSGSTGQRFPDQPDAIRRLAVDHWVSPVEFTKLIETMHADGIRLFVEAGPRGNLSAFVEDILRGKPFAALPANTSRRSGPTQINHLVAQLAAHHVPLNLDHLYERRVTEQIDHLFAPVNRIAEQFEQPPLPVDFDEEISSNASAFVMGSYLDSMEQFLDVQQDVMMAFLHGRKAGEPSAIDIARVFEAEFTEPVEPESLESYALLGHVEHHVPETPERSPSYALLGRIEHHVPGHELMARRVLDETEDRYADDHTLGGREVSRVDPRQNGLPVLPMTFSLEAMAEAASTLVPGKVVVAIKNVRLSRWLPFDPKPTTLEIRASVLSSDDSSGVVEVRADIRDLGNSFMRDGANKVASEAVIVLADEYPEPPTMPPFPLTAEQPCKVSVEVLRRNMFHGPIFQMIRTLDRAGNEGIEGTLEVQPRDRWLRSNPDPEVVIEPALVDAAMHIFGAWHLEQPDWTGRILLPFEVARIDFYGPPPAVGGMCLIRGHNEQESARHFRHGLEIFSPDKRLWLRMAGAGYWRFYLPFGHVNFFGPKDEYFLSDDWPEACPPPASRLDEQGKAQPQRCYSLELPPDLKQPVLRAAAARVTMTPRELAEFNDWTGTDAGLNDWFFGRMLAKDAVRAAWNEKHGEALYPADIEIDVDSDDRFVARPRGNPGPEPLSPVTVAMADGKVAAFSAFAPRVGIALLVVPKEKSDIKNLLASAAIRSVADALRIAEEGLTAKVDVNTGKAVVELSAGLSAKFPSVGKQVSVQTARQKGLVVATTTCEEAR
ncbi:acyltransferase domain-containing protein [Zavarzinella formosa]|uniref:acyltransferase domain-containing protein n=1 Tax=Zavarzinella formosa TaxID=360055 RepID=UPI00030D4D9A|nr:acyltransferase domain-containing protein [Zavarzinella formosa]